MKNKLLVIIFSVLSCLSAFSQKKAPPTPVIFDTDMGPDYDDVGAIAVLHAMADSGMISILATMASTRYEGVAAVLNVFNTYFKRPALPIGVPDDIAVDERDSQHWTDSLIARYPHAIKKNADAVNAVKLYRRLLAAAPDSSVLIITVGFLTNISGLLSSPPDNLSTLTGTELVRKKVSRLYSMAGRFPAGHEFNIFKDAPAAQFAFGHFPRPVIFCGFEIGEQIKTGLVLIHDGRITHSPVKDAFAIAIPQAAEDSAGRKSWDEATTLIAITGPGENYRLRQGTVIVADNGENHWNPGGSGQAYLVPVTSPAITKDIIERLMRHQPE